MKTMLSGNLDQGYLQKSLRQVAGGIIFNSQGVQKSPNNDLNNNMDWRYHLKFVSGKLF